MGIGKYRGNLENELIDNILSNSVAAYVMIMSTPDGLAKNERKKLVLMPAYIMMYSCKLSKLSKGYTNIYIGAIINYTGQNGHYIREKHGAVASRSQRFIFRCPSQADCRQLCKQLLMRCVVEVVTI
jgi:hypothetical protein